MRQHLRKTAARAFSAALLVAAAAGARPAGALTLDGPDAVIGQWDITLSTGPHGCRLALRGEQVRGGFFVGMPAGCRRALPVLASVVAWSLPGDNHLNLADVYGKPLLDFSAAKAGRLAATGPQGETYLLTLVEAAPPPTNQPAASATPAPAKAAALRPADIAGRYAVLREAGRDTGCMITLDISSRAFLSPACRDQGIVVFDPSAWRLAGGRLVLVARKGHNTQFRLEADGTWTKEARDADVKSLGLKKF